jgi:brefeldin A-inhibited guanine nucleotide-exchange protein
VCKTCGLDGAPCSECSKLRPRSSLVGALHPAWVQLINRFSERIATSAFEIVTRLNKDHFNAIVRHGAFADLTVCITDFCKVSKYQKISLLAIAMLRGVIPVMLECPECSWATPTTSSTIPMDDNMIKYWYPVLFGFYDIIMNGEDLEVRRL